MYSVLIADDEMTIRENLPKIIDFEAYGFRVTACVKNGEEALERIREEKPDLLMVDISMPILDGLGLIQKMQKEGYDDIPVIILSGYSNFSYAQKAVQLGVKAYLTKPIDEDETGELLTKMAMFLKDREHGTRQKWIDRKKQELENARVDTNPLKQQSEDYLLYCVMRGFLSNVNTPSGDSPILEPTSGDNSGQNGDTPYAALQRTMNQMLEGYDLLTSVMGFFYVLYLPKCYIVETFGSYDEFTRIMADALRENGLDCALALDSQILGNKEAFSEKLSQQRIQLLSQMFYNEQERVYVICGDSHSHGWRMEEAENILSELGPKLQAVNQEGALEKLTALYRLVEEKKPDFNEIADLNYKIFYVMTASLPMWEEYINTHIRPRDWMNSAYFCPFTKWQERFNEIVVEVCTHLRQNPKRSNLGLYSEILEYVRQHYHTPITIKEVADHFYLNAAYLGRMFQKATGVGFKQYVNAMRIAESKRLLAQTDKRIYEIAEMVGYAESKYFITKFIQEMGISPKEYRQTFRG